MAVLPRPFYLLVGDSHADALKSVMMQVASERHVTLRMMKQNCSVGDRDCSINNLRDEIAEFKIGTVVVHGAVMNAEAIKRLTELAEQEHFNVALIEPTPVFGYHVAERLYRRASLTPKLKVSNTFRTTGGRMLISLMRLPASITRLSPGIVLPRCCARHCVLRSMPQPDVPIIF